MSKIYVSEFPGLGQTDQSDSVNILAVPATAEYTVNVTTASTGSANPFASTTKFVEISTDTTCSFVIGPAGTTAGLNNCRLSPGERIIRRVPNVPPISPRQVQPAPAANFIFTTANV